MEDNNSMAGISASSPDQVSPSGQGSNDGSTIAMSNSKESPSFPVPKTDKPRPHVCTTCMRSFARLEHLKRHERSHTKEKPFECPECNRCFARRDLLLRHQQKLHSTTTPSSRPRTSRRESAAGVATGRVRKNSVANSTAGMRPRANTLSHVDAGTIGTLANTNAGHAMNRNFVLGHNHNNSFSGITGVPGYQYRGMSTGQNSTGLGLPRLDTGLPIDLSGGLRTAPPFGGFGAEMGINSFYNSANGNTINPSALHLHGIQSMGLEGSPSPYQHFFGAIHGHTNMPDDDNTFDWIAQGFENQMSFAQAHENAIDDSSPSAMSTSNSPAGISELMLDGVTTMIQPTASVVTPNWHSGMTSQGQMVNSPTNMDFSSTTFNDIMHVSGTMSPKSILAQNGLGLEMNFPTPPEMSNMESSSLVPDFSGVPFHLPFSRHGGASTASTSSMDSSLRQSSITTNPSPELVTDHIRNVLLAGLSQNSGFGQRKFSQPSISSPLSPSAGGRAKGFNPNNFPSLPELQRYVSAYIQYFHPHLPFLHIPSLNFESLEYSTPLRTMPTHSGYAQFTTAGGGCCLLLAMAAIGALYEQDMNNSRDLFEYAKRFISSFLEERRKANLSKTQFGPAQHTDIEDTPLWLVQAMLLNVIYGHNCGDKTAAELASNHCAALVSLARGAELARPPLSPNFPFTNDVGSSMVNTNIHMNAIVSNGWASMTVEPDDSDWRTWKVVEERKRTLYAVFILSSMLVSAYNHPPALTNSEIRLELPCDEELWNAESPTAWRTLGGLAMAESRAVPFSAALAHLLTAAQREQTLLASASRGENGPREVRESGLKPSSFGCLVLINALHNYIWETRQRHLGRQWTAQETEQMHSHIEPALRAWQAAWASNPSHSLERPNPFGAGPLSADSIPLLDLAYVRLFVNLGRSKEAFWKRDYDLMAEELAKGPEVIPIMEPRQRVKTEMPPPNRRASQSPSDQQYEVAAIHQHAYDGTADGRSSAEVETSDPAKPTQRERYLRKAASYAADSLATAEELGLTFADQTCRELPSQSAMCAFDCAQVLAEWVTTLQERLGKYLGIIGQDDTDLQKVEAVVMLEDDDRRLLENIDRVIQRAWAKMNDGVVPPSEGGFGSKILELTAHMLDRAAVWPVTKLMARSLETQASHMRDRATTSVAMRV